MADVLAVNNGSILVIIILTRKTVQILLLWSQNVALHLPVERCFVSRFCRVEKHFVQTLYLTVLIVGLVYDFILLATDKAE